MKERARDGLPPTLLAACAEGEVTPSEAALVADLLAASPVARRQVEELKQLRAGLAAPPAGLDAIDLAASVRAALQRETRETAAVATRAPAARRRWWAIGVGGTLAAGAAAIWLVARPGPQPEGMAPEEFAPKAAAGDRRPAAERWAGVRVYQEPAAPGHAPAPVGEVVQSGKGLLFSYSNLGPRPFSHLMIFSRDASGEVRWFFPAYEQAGSNPRSIPIRGPESDVGLVEIVRQPWRAGPLGLFALFTRRPLGVDEVERWLTAGASPPAADAPAPTATRTPPLPSMWGEAYLQGIPLVVSP